jgi:hypothetical protein
MHSLPHDNFSADFIVAPNGVCYDMRAQKRKLHRNWDSYLPPSSEPVSLGLPKSETRSSESQKDTEASLLFFPFAVLVSLAYLVGLWQGAQ